MILRNVGIISQHYTATKSEDRGSTVLRNDGTLPHLYTVSQPEDRGSMVLRNIGILYHYVALHIRKLRLESPLQ
jgi:hypothetical protein